MSRNTIVLNMDESKIQEEVKKELQQEPRTSFTRRGYKICSHNILGGTLRHLTMIYAEDRPTVDKHRSVLSNRENNLFDIDS